MTLPRTLSVLIVFGVPAISTLVPVRASRRSAPLLSMAHRPTLFVLTTPPGPGTAVVPTSFAVKTGADGPSGIVAEVMERNTPPPVSGAVSPSRATSASGPLWFEKSASSFVLTTPAPASFATKATLPLSLSSGSLNDEYVRPLVPGAVSPFFVRSVAGAPAKIAGTLALPTFIVAR